MPEKTSAPAIVSLGFGRFQSLKLTDYKALLACVSVGFFIRLVPELLAFPNPIGFDTIYYASVMKSGVIMSNWSGFFTTNWLLNSFIVPLYGITQVDPFLLLKLVSPLLYALNVAGIYWFARKNLGWSMPIGLLAGIFFALQLASLRISWDLLDNTLGLGILLFALSYVKEVGSKRVFAFFSALSLLVVFAHEYAAVILFATILGVVVWNLAKRKEGLMTSRLFLGISPALAVFLTGLYLRFFPIQFLIPTNIINAGDFISGTQGRLFFIVNYFRIQTTVNSYSSYWDLALSVGLLFAVLYLPYLFLVAKGYFRNSTLNIWTCLLLVGALGCLVVPFSALQLWYRWMFMLVYPFTFFAVYGLTRIVNKLPQGNLSISSYFKNKKAFAILSIVSLLGIAYLATPILMVYADTSVPTASGTYLYFSNSPTVPYQDVNSVVQAMNWLNKQMDSSSCVLLQHAYQNWGEIYLDKSHQIVAFDSDIALSLNVALANNFSRIYFVWWNQPIGWYNVSVPKTFDKLQDFGRISVYVYGGEDFGRN